jgi:hypothetical protein
MILASILNHFTGLQLRQAAEVVREQWDGWLTLVTKAERWAEQHPGIDPLLCIAIAWLSFEEGQSQRRYRVLLGDHHEIDRALAGESIYTVNFVSIARVLHALRDNARLADFTLPERLTIAPGEPGFEQWQEEIRAYQERAGARLAKTKPLATA